MAADRKYIDLEDDKDLEHAVDLAMSSKASLVVRRGGRNIAIVRPLEMTENDEEKTARDVRIEAAFRATAGGWEGNLDIDEFQEANRASRENSFREPISWSF